MRNSLLLATSLAAAALAFPALGQQPGATGGAIVASEPGRAVMAREAKLSAQVVGIDKATRTVTLKGPKGNVVDIVAGDDVKNFDQIKLGDFVVARYMQALTLELAKTKAGVRQGGVTEGAARAQPGERPAGAVARQVTVLADVIDVSPKNKTITLKGPKGNVVKLDVQNPDHFKVVKKGDQVEVVYTEALALSVEPAPKPAPKAPAKK
jgi:ribosomal protein L6P/L9E